VQSLTRGLSILECLATAEGGLTLTDVAQATGLARATARRALITLEHLGYVESYGRVFRLTPRVLASTKTPTWRESSNRSGPLVSRRTSVAPISASEQLLTNQPSSIGTGTPFASWMATWAGSAASSMIHHTRVGARSSAARRMELGGHIVEIG